MNAFPQSPPLHQLAVGVGVGETMANFPTLLMISLLLFPALACAARPEPAFLGKTAQHRPVVVEVDDAAAEEESCQGIGEEECLMRRTLAANVDYIYTQKHKQP